MQQKSANYVFRHNGYDRNSKKTTVVVRVSMDGLSAKDGTVTMNNVRDISFLGQFLNFYERSVKDFNECMFVDLI